MYSEIVKLLIDNGPRLLGQTVDNENPLKLLIQPLSLKSPAVMVLVLDGNSEIGAHVRSNLSYLICLKHRDQSTIEFISPKYFYRAEHVLGYHPIY